MKYIKKFENIIETSFIIDDLINYASKNDVYITSFLNSIFKYKVLVKFNCKKCYFYDENGAINYIHYNKIHKGIIQGTSMGFDENKKKIYLSLKLKRIKYSHEVDTSKPITIYGDINQFYLDIIDNINLLKNANKYGV